MNHRHANLCRDCRRRHTSRRSSSQKVGQRLRRLARRVESEELDDQTLERIEQKADDIYGDLSDNETYYFDRKPARRASDQTLDEAEQEAEDVYGDQSKNDTYYSF
jgi:hypothetical protein